MYYSDIIKTNKTLQEKIESNAGITYNRAENGYAVFTVGSGRYRFESKL
jgi:hypothetical protein